MQATKIKERIDQDLEASKIEIAILQRSLSDSQKLTNELFQDKERVSILLKKEALHIYRKFQLDVFTENEIYKSKALAGMN